MKHGIFKADLSDEELAAAEAATQDLLKQFAEPEPIAAPPDLAARVLAALPERTPAPEVHPWPRLGFAGGLIATLLLLMLSGVGLYTGTHLLLDDRAVAEAVPTRSMLSASLAATWRSMPLQQPLMPSLPLIISVVGLATLAFSSAIAVVWPCRTRGVALTLQQAPLQALGLGLLVTLPVGLAMLLLALSPLWMLLLLLPGAFLLHMPYLMGLTALGDALSIKLGLPKSSPSSAIVGSSLIILILILLGLRLPLFSVVLFYLLAGYGLGAVLVSRGGVMEFGTRR